MLRVYNLELLEVFDALHPCLLYFGNVEVGVAKSCNLLEVSSLVSLIFSLEVVKDVAYTEPVARNLVGICRTDALAGSAYLVLALRGFDGSIKHTVCRHDEMCLL